MGYFPIKGGKQMEEKTAIKQAILQINAGIRRLEKAYKYLDNHNVEEVKCRLSKSIDEANNTIVEIAKYMK